MAAIGSLYAMLGLNPSGFLSGLKKAQSAVWEFRSSIGKIGSALTSVQGLLAGVGIAASVGAFASLVKSSAESIDSVGKLSDKLGIATEKLVGLQHAAGLAGVENETLASAIEKMNRLIGDAAGGSDKASEALTSLGLSANQLKNLSPDVAFGQIADSIAAIENPAQRSAAAFGVFGKQASSIGSLLLGGSQGIATAQTEAERLGITVSRLEAAQVEAMLDGFTRLQQSITGVANQVAIQLAPYLAAVQEMLTDLISNGDGFKEEIGGAIEWVARSFGYLMNAVDVVRAGFLALRGVAGAALTGLMLPLEGILIAAREISEALGIDGLTGTLADAAMYIGELKVALAEGAKADFQASGDFLSSVMNDDRGNAIDAFMNRAKEKAQEFGEEVAKAAQQTRGNWIEVEDILPDPKEVTKAVSDSVKEAAPASIVANAALVSADSASSRLFSQNQQKDTAAQKALIEQQKQTKLQEKMLAVWQQAESGLIFGGF